MRSLLAIFVIALLLLAGHSPALADALADVANLPANSKVAAIEQLFAGKTGDERRKAELRIEQLNAKQKEKVSKRGLMLTIDERLVTAR